MVSNSKIMDYKVREWLAALKEFLSFAKSPENMKQVFHLQHLLFLTARTYSPTEEKAKEIYGGLKQAVNYFKDSKYESIASELANEFRNERKKILEIDELVMDAVINRSKDRVKEILYQLNERLFSPRSPKNMEEVFHLQRLLFTEGRSSYPSPVKGIYKSLEQARNYLKGSKYEPIVSELADQLRNEYKTAREIDKKIGSDMKWWREHSNELRPKYKGMYVAIGDKQVVASYSRDELAKLAKEKGIEISFTTYIERDDEYHMFNVA